MTRWPGVLAALVSVAACTSCTSEDLPRTDTSTLAATAPDTLVALPPPASPAASTAAPPPDTARPAVRAAADPADTLPITATPDELRALAPTLAIPVQGVRAAELRDSFDEARGGRVHEALDIHAPRGTPVLSAADGRLTKMHQSQAGGLMVYAADASERWIFMYGHLERFAEGLAEGMPLTRGQVVGYVGTSGNARADAPHLHFVVARGRPGISWWRGTPVNPYPLLVAH